MPIYVDNGLWILKSSLVKRALGHYAEQMVEIFDSFHNVNFCHGDFVKNQEHRLVTQENVLDFVVVNLFLMISL